MVMFNKNKLILITYLLIISLYIFPVSFSLEECFHLVEQGNSEAQWQLGQRYELGIDVGKNIQKAIVFYKKAAEQKHLKASKRLAEFYQNGTYLKKDIVLAAKYFAIANNLDVEEAIEKAKVGNEKNNEDTIEQSLNYIYGKNGKTKDIMTGFRMLYLCTRENISVQEVFVKCLCKTEKSIEILEYFDKDEQQEILCYLNDFFKKGYTDCGIILGKVALNNKEYKNAINYWQIADTSESWYYIGLVYDPNTDIALPLNLRKNEKLAIKAYKNSLIKNHNNDEARVSLGILYLLSKNEENKKYEEATENFNILLKKEPTNLNYMCLYGISGVIYTNQRIDNSNYTYELELEQLVIQRTRYLKFIERAAEKGNELAKSWLSSDNDNE